MMTIEIWGCVCAFTYSTSVSANEEACIASITLFPGVWYVKHKHKLLQNEMGTYAIFSSGLRVEFEVIKYSIF